MSNANDDRAGRLRASWDTNAAAWTAAVREGTIASRRLATDGAVVAAVLRLKPRRVLDVGCGEGWLVRALAAHGVEGVGVDASADLIAHAREQGGGRFLVASYDEVAQGTVGLEEPFDAVVCNFALLDEDLVPLLKTTTRLVRPGGRLVIQTVHPWTANGEAPYVEGWREETFDGFGGAFVAPMPWYFRTLASWVGLLTACGYRLERLEEPAHPETGTPLSLLLTAVAG